MSFVLAIDQGTTSTRAIVFGGPLGRGERRRSSRSIFRLRVGSSMIRTTSGPRRSWSAATRWSGAALKAKVIAAIGITNERETTVLRDRDTEAVHRAIVWQDRRTADSARRLRRQGHEPAVSGKPA